MSFRRPVWSAPLDPAPYLARAPKRATAKGMFFGMVQQELGRVGKLGAVAEAAETYRSFKDYPYLDLLKLEVAACPQLYPGLTLRESMRKLGTRVFPMFLNQMIGRVIFGVVGKDPQQLLKLAARGYAVAASVGTATAIDVGETCGTLRLRNVCNFPSSFHVGVLEGTLKHIGVTSEVEVLEHDLFDVDLRAHWG